MNEPCHHDWDNGDTCPKCGLKFWVFSHAESVREINQLKETISGLERDKARLDWVLEHCFIEVDPVTMCAAGLCEFLTSRENIDAAMAKEGK